MAQFNIVKSNTDGGVELYPMKEWLRQHPDSVPSGMHPTASTSRQLLSGLKKLGWKYEETSSEVRLFPPNETINTQAFLRFLVKKIMIVKAKTSRVLAWKDSLGIFCPIILDQSL